MRNLLCLFKRREEPKIYLNCKIWIYFLYRFEFVRFNKPIKTEKIMTISVKKLKKGEFVVYPTHGVGQIMGTEQKSIGGMEVELIVINFEQDRLMVRVPSNRAPTSGLRLISSKDTMDEAVKSLKGRMRAKKTMWARRAMEYEAKINSGNPQQLAEVVRDLYKPETQVEQSFSERQLFQTAITRLAREYALVEEIDEKIAQTMLISMMDKQAA